MNHITLYQIAIERHNDRLQEAAQARLRRIATGGHHSEDEAGEAAVVKESLPRLALRKTTALLKGLAVGLLILSLAGWGFVTTTYAQSQQVIEVGCTNGVGDVNSLIFAINIANIKPQEDTIVLAENCIYTLIRNLSSSDNGLPIIITIYLTDQAMAGLHYQSRKILCKTVIRPSY
jgi:hypothetical protein